MPTCAASAAGPGRGAASTSMRGMPGALRCRRRFRSAAPWPLRSAPAGGSGQNGGNTACGTLTAPGGQGFSGATAASAYRFHDPDKASEQGTAGAAYDSYSPGGGGWQHFRGVRNHGSGYGGGGCRVGEGKYADGFPGALVIRIPM